MEKKALLVWDRRGGQLLRSIPLADVESLLVVPDEVSRFGVRHLLHNFVMCRACSVSGVAVVLSWRLERRDDRSTGRPGGAAAAGYGT